MSQEQSGWTEEDSALYRELSAVAVPRREEQLAALVGLLPFGRDEAFGVVELGCGEGVLAAAVLDAYPRAGVLCLDGSASMLREASARLERFGERARLGEFDLASTEWRGRMSGADAVVSSLALHHLSGEGKRRLFEDAAREMSERAALLVADVVEPRRDEAWRYYADMYDLAAELSSREQTGSGDLYKRLVEEEWNFFRFPDPGETPSPLFDQLAWLSEAGFESVDCFWLLAGHAVYGGYMSAAETTGDRVSYGEALEAVRGQLAQN